MSPLLTVAPSPDDGYPARGLPSGSHPLPGWLSGGTRKGDRFHRLPHDLLDLGEGFAVELTVEALPEQWHLALATETDGGIERGGLGGVGHRESSCLVGGWESIG